MNITQEIKLQPLPATQKPMNVWRRLLRLSDRFLHSYMAYKAAELQRMYDLPVTENGRNRQL
ncbi:hypothetical protein [Aliamphritea hakodatensis]|uniref:hypothetical protein n=1 Tax=Aliamphritea hakodatensis TaxID=2895352 RepID=UPI0022FD4F1E|nr:hypothetical protein [Aliamphritea hakodatensis]